MRCTVYPSCWYVTYPRIWPFRNGYETFTRGEKIYGQNCILLIFLKSKNARKVSVTSQWMTMFSVNCKLTIFWKLKVSLAMTRLGKMSFCRNYHTLFFIVHLLHCSYLHVTVDSIFIQENHIFVNIYTM